MSLEQIYIRLMEFEKCFHKKFEPQQIKYLTKHLESKNLKAVDEALTLLVLNCEYLPSVALIIKTIRNESNKLSASINPIKHTKRQNGLNKLLKKEKVKSVYDLVVLVKNGTNIEQ